MSSDQGTEVRTISLQDTEKFACPPSNTNFPLRFNKDRLLSNTGLIHRGMEEVKDRAIRILLNAEREGNPIIAENLQELLNNKMMDLLFELDQLSAELVTVEGESNE